MKKLLAILLVAAIMTASLVGLASASTQDAASPYYMSITGLVVNVEEVETGLSVELAIPSTDRDGTAFLNITDATVFPFEEELEEGDTVTAFYLANAPMILIYPPRYNAAVVVAGVPESTSVIVDRFNAVEGSEGRYLAQGGNLIINLGPDTEVVLADGTEFNFEYGGIDGRRLVVIYGVATRMMPPSTTPTKIIVLFEDAVTGPLPLSPEELPSVPVITLPAPIPGDVPVVTLPAPAPGETIDASGWPIQVNGTNIAAPAAFQTADGILMVPLRAIAEALGYEVNWDGATRGVRLGVAINAWVGNTEVHIGRMAPQTIATAPVLVDGTTFVPLEFFRVIGVNNAFAFEGQIVIDSENERME